MKNLKFAILFALMTITNIASAGTLQTCEGVSTPQGFRYIGTYCFDFACSYTFTRVFNGYCPYNSN